MGMIKFLLHQLLLIVQGCLIILIAPLILGWITQVKCWLQQRSAPSMIQPYYVIQKLFIKKPVLAENASWIFRSAPYIYLVSLVAICFSIPFFIVNTFSSNMMDIIVLVGLLALGRIFLALAAMDIGTAFGNLGARREMLVACLAEPVLLIALYNITLLTHSAYLSGNTLYFLHHITLYPSLIFSLLALFLVLIAETGRIPIDNPATHLELTMIHEAMILEYSGRYLALIEWGNAIKLVLYLSFIMSIFIPIGISLQQQISWVMFGLLTSLLKLFLLSALIGVIESINSKLRLFKVPDYLVGAFTLAVLGVLVTQVVGVAS